MRARILWETFRNYRWHLAALVLFGFLSAILEGIGINAVIPLLSFFTGASSPGTDFVTRAIQGLFGILHLPFSFRYLLGFILFLFILRAIAVVVFGYIRGWIGADFLGKETEEMLRRTFYASWPFLLRQKIGTMHNTLVRDIQNSGVLLGVMAQVVQSFSGFFMYLLVAVNISPVMTLYTLGGGGFVFLVLRPLLGRTQRLSETAQAIEKQFSQFLSEHIIGMKSVKAAGAERATLAGGAAQIALMRGILIRQALVRSISSSLFQPASLLLVGVLFLLTYHSPDFSIISFATALYLIQKIFTYLESGQTAFVGASELIPYAENVSRVKRMLAEHEERVSRGGAPFSFSDSLSFVHVSFVYEGSQPVLDDVSFTVRRGETIGLIGPSGAGKTSVADLMLRLFTPVSGALLLDGVPAEQVSIDDWRKRIGYVSQDVFLLNDTIEENIRFYRQDLSVGEVAEAAKKANIYDFIQGLPAGMHTIVGDNGVMLSGGQRQRIALARALAGAPELLILDEATSALDAASEKLVQEAIGSLQGSVTVFVIAHRLSTVESADRILVLERGSITEQGTPDELLTNPDSYFARHYTRR